MEHPVKANHFQNDVKHPLYPNVFDVLLVLRTRHPDVISMSGAATETTIHYLLPSQLYSVQKVELPNGAYKLDSTLKNSSEDQSLTVLLYGSQKFALNVNKEIIRLTVKLFKILRMFCSTPFLINKICIYFFLFLFFILSIHLLFLYVSLYRAYCK